MYHAKNNGKARYEFFDPLMRTRIMERMELESDLRRALDNQELRVFYQLILSLEDKKIQGFEALVRWQHPKRGLLLPKDFILLAEETGLIISVDRWVLSEACQQLVTWQREFPSLGEISISVNLSDRQFSHPDLVAYIQEVINKSGLDPSCLNIEITESIIVENREMIIERCNQIQSLGVQIQIDDFGSGYSSLSYLSQFQFNALKIDRSFIEKIHHHSSDSQIVEAIVALSHRLGIEVIAEGVENENQIDQLKSIGCQLAQGFFLSQPLNSIDATRYLINHDTA